jgi:glycosyltransferase involved in cell wall biosynthesis
MTLLQKAARRVFYTSAGVVVGTYVGFPAALVVRARLAPRPVRASAVTPSIAVVIAAHNEEAGLGDKLRSVLACDYPDHLREVVVASDGSTDRTVEVARSFAARGVRTLDLPRAGKAATLNAAVAGCRADVVVLSDANNPLDPAALREIVRPFADPEVGGVAGDQRYVPVREDDGTTGERSYWALDRMVKEAETASGNVVSATGALYAVRRELFPEVIEGVTDDFWVSTNVIRSGHRLVLATDAVVYEVPSPAQGLEFQRKVRVMTRGLFGVYERRELLDPRRFGFYSVQLACHKVLRRLMVVPLVLMWVASIAAARRGGWFWKGTAAAQTAGYGVAALGLRVRLPGVAGRVLALGSYFVMVNAASATAVWNLLRGRRITRWEPARTDQDAA